MTAETGKVSGGGVRPQAAGECQGAGRLAVDGEVIQRLALDVAAAEVRGIQGLTRMFGSDAFRAAIAMLLGCRGRVLICGLGKAGLAGQRIAASLRSTGTPSIFVHPVEALHGDLGIVDPQDVALLISKSGENPEVSALVPTFRRVGVAIIALTARGDSELARSADIVLDIGPVQEIAPLDEVPTVSTTLFQVTGDALTIILCRLKGFTSQDFAFLHPGGILGRRVSQRVADVMHAGADLPRVGEETPLTQVLVEIMEKRLGMTTVVDAAGRLRGVIADGDLKRILHRTGGSLAGLNAGDVMTREPRAIEAGALLVTALKLMETNQPGAITFLVVVDEAGRPAGVVHIHDCLRPPANRP